MTGHAPGNACVIVSSYHHKNTERIARTMAQVLDTVVVTPTEVGTDGIRRAGLTGLGSGIHGEAHHGPIPQLAEQMGHSSAQAAFIFSTLGAPSVPASPWLVSRNHARPRAILQFKGHRIVGEFGRPGFNTNSLVHLFGGRNKGRPNDGDLGRARQLALSVSQQRKSETKGIQ